MEMEMASKPHAVCIPFPAQGHINPMLQLAKLLHHLHGFHITFVNTEYDHNRLLASGASSLDGLDDFRFVTVPDGLTRLQSVSQDLPSIFASINDNFTGYLRDLVDKLQMSDVPPITCFVSDGIMSFTLDVAAELGIPDVLFWTTSACGFMAYLHYRELVNRDLVPFKDESYLTNGYLDTPTEWIPGMKHMRLRDFPSFARTTDAGDILFSYLNREAQRASMAAAIIMNTYDLERPTLDTMSLMLPTIYTVGPLTLLSRQVASESPIGQLGLNLWKEDTGYLRWLEGKEPQSVIYVNFGSTTLISSEQLTEIMWGLLNSGHDFLWVIRPDLVGGVSGHLQPELSKEISKKGLVISWCQQQEVLLHPAIGGFFTHCGWNSTIESICGGVPMLCWPFFAEQQTNCRYASMEWGVGMEVNENVRREELARMIRELMGGEQGKQMRKRALEWKKSAVMATGQGGTSFLNLDRVVNDVMLAGKKYLIVPPSSKESVEREMV